MIDHYAMLALFLLVVTTSVPALAGKPAGFERDLTRFTQGIAAKHGFDREELGTIFSKIEYRQGIIDAISRPAESKPWYRYRPIFVTASRARQGVEFWSENEQLLQQAQNRYGVPPEIIVAIIGVESRYGRHRGGFPVLDALATLGFGYPKRGAFFRRELEQFLLLTREESIDPNTTNGSYAGAMGKPQFIPSSYRRYAVDFDGDGQRDLFDSNADVIGSVAAYFKQHGWKTGAPIAIRARGATGAHDRYRGANLKPSTPLGMLRAAGIEVKLDLPDEELSSLIKLEQEFGSEYWLGLHNFYVITRYNHSNLYAMAVYQLSREILERRTEQMADR